VPAERADNLRLLAVDDGDVISEVMKQRCVVATVQHELLAREHPFEYVFERLRLAIKRLFFFGHVPSLLEKRKPPPAPLPAEARWVDSD
jgi:hypothetical protein